MMNAHPWQFGDWPRWCAVMDVFALGKNYARELCESHGLDPDEIVMGLRCETCDEDSEI